MIRAALGAAMLAMAGLAAPAVAQPQATPAARCDLSAVEIVTRFSQLFFIEKKWREAFLTYVAEDYTQHNPMAEDGRAAALAHLGPVFDANPQLKIDIKRIFGDETHVAVHYHSVMKPGDLGAAAVDMFRVEDCKIVEHWDVIQPMPAKSANPHPMF
ncbi:MAG: polyketide cyclase [Sphingobium sp. 66-54]|nr:MAG: polyketide cyclase [Sphingobium sp. 66-54]